jgi:hypothetical protein
VLTCGAVAARLGHFIIFWGSSMTGRCEVSVSNSSALFGGTVGATVPGVPGVTTGASGVSGPAPGALPSVIVLTAVPPSIMRPSPVAISCPGRSTDAGPAVCGSRRDEPHRIRLATSRAPLTHMARLAATVASGRLPLVGQEDSLAGNG